MGILLEKTKSQGFTLLELMITVSIAAILVAVAVPSFTGSIKGNQLTTQTNEFIAALNLTKSEAIKRGIQVTMRRKGSNSGQWESGWDIFIDINGNNVFNDNGTAPLCEISADGSPSEDCVLRSYDALSSGFTLRTGNSAFKDYAAYLATGMSKGNAGETFRLCLDSSTATSRAIVINSIGRVRVLSSSASCP